MQMAIKTITVSHMTFEQ